MNKYINNLLTKFRTWKEAKVEHTPLNAENAYTLSAINKKTTLVAVYEKYKKEVLTGIKNTASLSGTERYVAFPEYLIKGHKEQLVTDLKELGYDILYNSGDSIIISWRSE